MSIPNQILLLITQQMIRTTTYQLREMITKIWTLWMSLQISSNSNSNNNSNNNNSYSSNRISCNRWVINRWLTFPITSKGSKCKKNNKSRQFLMEDLVSLRWILWTTKLLIIFQRKPRSKSKWSSIRIKNRYWKRTNCKYYCDFWYFKKRRLFCKWLEMGQS